MAKNSMIIFLILIFYICVNPQSSDLDKIERFGEKEIEVESVLEYEVSDFNAIIIESVKKSEDWAQDPLLIAIKSARYLSTKNFGWEIKGNKQTIEMNLEPHEIHSDTKIKSAIISIANYGLTDDSIGGDRFQIYLIRNEEDIWQISQVLWALRCTRVSGIFYSAGPCP